MGMTFGTDWRQVRGHALAKLVSSKIRTRGQGVWVVPSASHGGSYVVDLEENSCTCPDHGERQIHCKHQWAVEYVLQRVTAPDGTVIETTAVRYTQNWTSYNLAQTHEKERLADLLKDLCSGIPNPVQKRGRPRLPLSDVIFCSAMKVYLASSGRRATSDMRDLVAKGYMDKAPHYNSIFRYLEKPELTPILKRLVEESAAPLKAVESDFAVDSSGFSTSVYERWFDHKWGKTRSINKWVKAHLMVGVKTNVVSSVEVTAGEGKGTGDPNHLIPLVASAVQRGFNVQEVSADKAYSTKANLKGVSALGAVPYVPFKSNSTPGSDETTLWHRLWHFFQFNKTEFLQHYHKRSNSETAFQMIKAKFGGAVRSKKFTAQVNEVLLKVLCHNLCRLVHAIYELGIEPTFWGSNGRLEAVR